MLRISKYAINAARKNALLNQFDDRFNPLCADAFKQLQIFTRQNETFDLIIIDPPSMAKSSAEKPIALAKYRQLACMGAQLLKKGGVLLLASCSSRITLEDFITTNDSGFKEAGQTLKRIKIVGHDLDHPDKFIEMSYLKAIYYTK